MTHTHTIVGGWSMDDVEISVRICSTSPQPVRIVGSRRTEWFQLDVDLHSIKELIRLLKLAHASLEQLQQLKNEKR